MDANSPPRHQKRKPRNEGRVSPSALDEAFQDDFALVQLDTRFVTLLSEISGLDAQHSDGQGREAESVRSAAAGRTQKIESVLARLEPVERAIMATPARTIVGLGIKARHAAYVVSEHWNTPIEQIDWDARAVRLLIEAICKAAGVRLPFPLKRANKRARSTQRINTIR
ncbi:hypothetical protein [Bradyrhizobium aeschynomenes]|uniref:hypothetical protein n=1 Tax=Bradyrhizobium aeschynomenes TaxID=2734909 RepID=UPI001FF071AA|nr:hypothetical protein [Bradyrhizobium aeschynomenes]